MNEEEPPSPRANSSFFIISSSLKKRSSRPVSRVLYPVKLGTPVIYLVRLSPSGFSGLPSDMERATLLTPVYMTLQLPRRTALVSPQGRWALTPPSHPYRRIAPEAVLFFCVTPPSRTAFCCPDFPPVPRKAQATGRPTASPGTKVRKVGGVAKGCRKSLSKLSRQVLVKSLFIPYPSLVPLLSLSYLSLIPFFHLRFIFVSGLFFLRLEMRVVWDRNGNRSCMVPSVCHEFPFIAFIPHLVKMGDDSFCHIGSLSDKIPSMAGPECFGTPFVLN